MRSYKRILAIILSSALIFSVCPLTVTAANEDQQITISYRNVNLLIDGAKFTPKDAAGNIVEPFIYQGTTYLPVRAVSEALGKEVNWDSQTNTVIIGGSKQTDFSVFTPPVKNADETITASYRDIKITVNGTSVTPKDEGGNVVEPFIYNGSTYLPVRGISTALGKEVSFISATNTVAVGLQPVQMNYSKTSPAPVGTTQRVLVNNATGRYIAKVTVSRFITDSAAEDIIYKASALNRAPSEGKKYGLASITVSIEQSANDAPVTLDTKAFTVYDSNLKPVTFASIVAPKPAFNGTIKVGQILTGYFPYIVSTTERSPRCVFGQDENGEGGAWMKLYQG